MAMRTALICIGLLLGGCNMVVTKTPLFSKADTAGEAQLRPGLWRETPQDPCDFDETKPFAEWPGCANGFIVKDGQVGGYNTDADGKKTWTSSDLVVAGGEPRVIQVLLKDLGVKGLGELPFGPMYLYMAAHPTKTDDQGRIVAYTAWPILCGPPPPPDAKGPDGKAMRMGTLKPLPGLTMDKDDNNCTTSSQAVVEAAAKASAQWQQTNTTSEDHWVRDGTR
jgi:hypothetical protein